MNGYPFPSHKNIERTKECITSNSISKIIFQALIRKHCAKYLTYIIPLHPLFTKNLVKETTLSPGHREENQGSKKLCNFSRGQSYDLSLPLSESKDNYPNPYLSGAHQRRKPHKSTITIFCLLNVKTLSLFRIL